MKCWLDCPECGEDAIESDADGLFCEDMEARCPGCGARVGVRVDESSEFDDEGHGFASSRLLDEDAL